MLDLNDFKSYTNFTAIDFETANGNYNSICQIGLIRVEQGEIVHEWEQLVQPPGNTYHWGNSRIHGLHKKDTAHAPTFNEVWETMKPFIQSQHVVAHNAPFDCTCLERTLEYYHIPIPTYQKHCTVKIYKRNLAFLCEQFGIELDHHNALSDARGCAMLFLKYLKESVGAK